MMESAASFEQWLAEAEQRTQPVAPHAAGMERAPGPESADERTDETAGQTSIELEHALLQAEVARREAESAALAASAAHEETARVRAELDEARREAAATRQRLRVLVEAGAAMQATLQVDAVLEAVTGAAARRICDYSVAFLLGADGCVDRAVGAHRDPARFGIVQRLANARLPDTDSPTSIAAQVLRTGKAVLLEHVPSEQFERVMAPGEQRQLAEALGFDSLIVVPLLARGRTLGALALVRSDGSSPFDDEDFSLAKILAVRAGLAVDNARLYQERDNVAETLRRSLLPPGFPVVPGLEIGSRYLPAAQGTQVGGDFFDLFPMGDRWLVVIGDVVGKGAEAAAMMALARYTIRTAALSEDRPSAILDVLNRAILSQTTDHRFCTACCIRLARSDDGFRATVSSGGHPLPLVLGRDGGARAAGIPGTIVGVFEDPVLADRVVDLRPGESLVLYTDGVTDERDEHDREFGEVRLGEVLRGLRGEPAQRIADGVVEAVERFRVGRARDDIAVLTLRVLEPGA